MKRFPVYWVAAAALALALVPLGLLTYFSISLSSKAVKTEVEDRVKATASIGGTLVQSDLNGLAGIVQSYATRPYLRKILEDRAHGLNADSAIAKQLRELRNSRPGISTTFLAEPDGRLLGIDPPTPSIVGVDFSYRDWYRGVQRTGRTYVSRAYVSRATGHPRIVAVTVPVRVGPGGREIAILVAAYGFRHIQSVVDNLAEAQGVRLRVTDQKGIVVAQPGGSRGLTSAGADPRVAAALAGRKGVMTIRTPKGSLLSAFAPVPSLGWTVSSSVPSRNAYARMESLRTAVAVIAATLGLLLLLGVIAFVRALWRRAQVEAELARQASINTAVLDNVRDGIRMTGIDGSELLANARMRELGTELFGTWPVEGTLEDVAAGMADPDRFLETLRLESENPDAELVSEYELAASRRCFVRYSAPVADGTGARLGRLMVVREITAEREAERLKSDLVATVSHELRTPLTGVLGFAELLRRPDLDAATRERYATTIYTEAKRLTNLINDFLDLQRIEAGALTLSLEVVELGDVIRQATEVFRGDGDLHRLELDLPDEPLEVAADPQRVAQVLANLLSNATKYSPAGGTIRVAATANDGAARVEVSDPGIGIPADQQRRLFSKFFRVDSSDTRSIGGTGLGLALAREIVETHGGRIGVRSVEGEGSTFWFELPFGGERSASRPRVLVVEDDAGAAELLVTFLGDDFDVEVAATGEDALGRARRRPPAVVCLDIGLPGDLTGWQVLAGLKDDARTAHVPVIVCTGANGRRRASALGAADFLTKPFTREVLLETISKLLPARGGDVLVVEDDRTVRKLVAVTLEHEGHQIREAADGHEALAAIAALPPDAIVLDLMMPGLDGFGVLEELQASEELRGIPVLVLTARRLSVEERDLLAGRAVSLLEKSDYSPAELRRLIHQALGREALERV